MRTFFQAHFLLILCLIAASDLPAQEVPSDIPAWQLVKTFIQKTGSPEKGIDRKGFAETRLTGEAAKLDPESLRGRWRQYIDVYIDTVIILPERYIRTPGDSLKGIPPRTDTIRRSALAITTYISGLYDNVVFFCEQDSIWRIESWRQFPTVDERLRIGKEMGDLDTAEEDYMLRRSFLTYLLFPEKELQKMFTTIKKDASGLTDQLFRSSLWSRIDLYQFVHDTTAEYDPLDEENSPYQLFLFRLNQAALHRLFSNGIWNILRYQDGRRTLLLFEIASWEGTSMGYLTIANSGESPRIDKDEFFSLHQVAPEWWFYKGRLREENIRQVSEGLDELHPQGGEVRKRSTPVNSDEAERHSKSGLLLPKEKEEKKKPKR